MAHEMTFLSAEVRALRAANEALNKHRRFKKTHARQGGALIVEDARDMIAHKEAEESQQSKKHCKACGETGHNARTCKNTIS